MKLLAFFQGAGRDGAGRSLEEILAWPDEQLEWHHDFIQWLFPLRTRSGANPGAPVLDRETIAAFHASPALRDRLRAAFARMLAFYGFRLESGAVARCPDFSAKSALWLRPGNHNHLRITRILTSLRELGLPGEAQAFYLALCAVERESPGKVTRETLAFWHRAAAGP